MLANLAVLALALSLVQAMSLKRVVVSGAGGRTGSLVFNKLVDTKLFEVVGLVRSAPSAKKLSGGGTILEVDTMDETKVSNAFEGALHELVVDAK